MKSVELQSKASSENKNLLTSCLLLEGISTVRNRKCYRPSVNRFVATTPIQSATDSQDWSSYFDTRS